MKLLKIHYVDYNKLEYLTHTLIVKHCKVVFILLVKIKNISIKKVLSNMK